MSTLYIIQNETHLDNFLELCKSDDDYNFIIIDKFCGFEIKEEKLNKIRKDYLRLDAYGKGIYRVTGIYRLLKIIGFIIRKPYSNLSLPQKIVIGNDGSVQKIIIHYFKKMDPSISVELWSDGLLEKVKMTTFKKVMSLIEPGLDRIRVTPFLPSITGCSSLIDTAYVMSESCKNSIVVNGFKGQTLEVKEFPRHVKLKEIERSVKKHRLLLVVSAFSWHGRDDIEKWEIELVRDFVKMAGDIKEDKECSIRVHPRSSEALCNIIMQSGIASDFLHCEEDIVNSDVVISYASTCLFDAYVLGKQVYTYSKGAPYISRGDFVEGLPMINELDLVFYK